MPSASSEHLFFSLLFQVSGILPIPSAILLPSNVALQLLSAHLQLNKGGLLLLKANLQPYKGVPQAHLVSPLHINVIPQLPLLASLLLASVVHQLHHPARLLPSSAAHQSKTVHHLP